jgi:hypothetical protein
MIDFHETSNKHRANGGVSTEPPYCFSNLPFTTTGVNMASPLTTCTKEGQRAASPMEGGGGGG